MRTYVKTLSVFCVAVFAMQAHATPKSHSIETMQHEYDYVYMNDSLTAEQRQNIDTAVKSLTEACEKFVHDQFGSSPVDEQTLALESCLVQASPKIKELKGVYVTLGPLEEWHDQVVTGELHQRIGHDSNWHIVGCEPNQSLTLFYADRFGTKVTQVVHVKGQVSYSIAKDVGYTDSDDLSALAGTISLLKLDGCTATLAIR